MLPPLRVSPVDARVHPRRCGGDEWRRDQGCKVYPPGTALTARDVLTELPFDNRILTIEIAGADLRRALENGLSQLPNPGGRFPQVSGLTIEADASRPAGDRIVSIRVGDTPLDERKIYRIATNYFMARGGDGYTGFRDAKPLLSALDAPLVANAVIAHIKALGIVRTEVKYGVQEFSYDVRVLLADQNGHEKHKKTQKGKADGRVSQEKP